MQLFSFDIRIKCQTISFLIHSCPTMKWKREVSQEELEVASSLLVHRKHADIYVLKSILRRIDGNPFDPSSDACCPWMGNQSCHVQLAGKTTYVRRALYSLYVDTPSSNELVSNKTSCGNGVVCCKLRHLELTVIKKRRVLTKTARDINRRKRQKFSEEAERYIVEKLGVFRKDSDYRLNLKEAKRLFTHITGDLKDRNSCSIWTGPLCGAKVGDSYISPARVIYELFIGKIPAGKRVLRSCINSSHCVNPCHLTLSTYSIKKTVSSSSSD